MAFKSDSDCAKSDSFFEFVVEEDEDVFGFLVAIAGLLDDVVDEEELFELGAA